jgi:transcriptional regulator with XRE-family HTH domain
MFESLRALIRLEREKRNLSQQALADLAHVSRWQLAMFETGKATVSFDFVIKVVKALGLTEIVVDGLRVRAAAADLPALLAATDAVATATRVVHRYREMARELDGTAAELAQATATLDALVKRSVSSAGSTAAIARAAERLGATRPEDEARAGRALRELTQPTEPRIRTARVKPPAKTAARRRAR